ncbi:MAG: substrate-binding domain-containing protein [Lentisphaeria bacterium]|nr:substrate-binding domain-containing protein [Lentisphaeria bacterium]
MSKAPLRIGIIISYEKAIGRELVDAVVDFKFKLAAEPWEIAFVNDWQSTSFDHLRGLSLDGLIAPVYQNIAGYRSLGIPVVNITEPLPGCPFPTVTFNNREIGMRAAREFIAMNLRRCYCVQPHFPVNEERNRGFVDTLAEHDIECQTIGHTISGNERVLAGFQIPLLDLKAAHVSHFPAGVFCSDDRYGLAVIQNCRQLGLNVPDQISVIGVNNEPFLCRSLVPELSSIPINVYEVGTCAAGQLQRLFQGLPPTRHCTRVSPGSLVRRHSSDRLDCADPVVADALRYIRAHIAEYFDVSDILRFAAVSRRTLENRFREHAGKTIHQTIVSERLDFAETLLRDTRLPQNEVATRSGFPNLHAFHTAFRRRHSTTPSRFRAGVRVRD